MINDNCLDALEGLGSALNEYPGEDTEYSEEDEDLDAFLPVGDDHPIKLAVIKVQDRCYGGKPLPDEAKRKWQDFLYWTRLVIVEDERAAGIERDKGDNRTRVVIEEDEIRYFLRKRERKRRIEDSKEGLLEWVKRSIDTLMGGTGSGHWQKHVFDLRVNEETRCVGRRGFEKTVDLSSKMRWHIFRVVLAAARKQAALDTLEKDYPGEWDARATAVNDLNKYLAPLKVKVHNRTLFSVLD